MKRAHSDVIQSFPVTTYKIKVTGESQEIKTKIRNYTLIRIQTFLKDFMQQAGEWGTNWSFACLFGMGSELLFTAVKMGLLAGISKDPKFHNFLKDPSRLYAHCLQDTTDLKSPWLSPERNKTKEHNTGGAPATKGKADRVIKASSAEEEGNGKPKSSRATNMRTRALPLLSWIFIA